MLKRDMDAQKRYGCSKEIWMLKRDMDAQKWTMTYQDEASYGMHRMP